MQVNPDRRPAGIVRGPRTGLVDSAGNGREIATGNGVGAHELTRFAPVVDRPA